jgi:hypothetical protein
LGVSIFYERRKFKKQDREKRAGQGKISQQNIAMAHEFETDRSKSFFAKIYVHCEKKIAMAHMY